VYGEIYPYENSVSEVASEFVNVSGSMISYRQISI
jgi:hypothetical protein